jgi:hypothetical protein
MIYAKKNRALCHGLSDNMATSSQKKHKSTPNKSQLQKRAGLSWIWQGFFDKISLLRGLVLAQADEPKMKSLLIIKKQD